MLENCEVIFNEENNRKADVSLGIIHGNLSKLILVFGRFSQIFKTKFLVQTLLSPRSMYVFERFMDQNLR